MSAFDGRWRLVSSSNLAELFKATGSEKSLPMVGKMEDTSDTGMQHVNTVTDTEFKTDMYAGDMLMKTIVSRFNEKSEVVGLDGQSHKVFTTIEGNKITSKADKFVNIHEVDGDELTMTLTAGDVVCVRKYKKVAV